MAILEANQIHKSYGNKFNKQEVLKGIDIRVDKGEFVSIMGASGSGKTTLLNVLSSIDKVSLGSIKIEGKEFTGLKEKELAEFRKHHLGFIFQEYNLLDTLTVKENVLLPLSIKKVSKKKPIKNSKESRPSLASMSSRINIRTKSPGDRSSGPPRPARSSTIRALFLRMSRQERWTRSPHPIC